MIFKYRQTLRRLFTAVQRLAEERENVTLCADIQKTLLRKIIHVEGRIRHHRVLAKNSRKMLGTKTEPPRSREAALALRAHVTTNETRAAAYKRLLYVLKSVGDSIAFLYIDKWDIKPVSFREAPGFVSGKAGLKHELQIARWAWRRGATVILNDLTNCLRLGDVTIPRGDGSFMLMELKAGRKGPRGDKQERALAKVQSYLITDEATDLYGNRGTYRRFAVSSDERHHRAELNTLIADAHKSGVAFSEVERGLFYVCTERSTTLTSVALEIRGKCLDTPIVAMVNEAKYDQLGYFPFTLSIEDPDALIRFWDGSLFIAVVLDPAALHEQFAQRGYRASLDLNSLRPLAVYSSRSTRPDGLLMNVGFHYFNRLFVEFLSLDWMIGETLRHPIEEVAGMEGLLAAKPGEPENSGPSLSG